MENNYQTCTVQQYSCINNYSRINEIIKNDYHKKNKKVGKGSYKILDIGCSLGLNSIYQCNSIINEIRVHDRDKLIEIFHCDLPINNFSVLFDEINTNPNTYLKQFNNVFAYGVGKSFVEQIMPNESCDIIFSYNTFHWGDPKNSIFSLINKDLFLAIKPENRPIGFDEYGKQLLTNSFLTRYNELRPGGILSCNFLTYDSTNPISEQNENVWNKIKDIYREMANEGILSNDEVDKMHAPIIFYTNEQVDYSIKQAEERGLKLLNKEQIVLNWGKTNQDPISNLIGYISILTKRFINGDDSKQSEIQDEFKKRINEKYKENPQSYDYNLTFDLLLFKKNKK